MKKVSILLFALTAILWAKVDIEIVVHIEFPKEVFLNEDELEETSDVCKDFDEVKNARNEYGGLGCGYAGLCRSMLDSNVLLGWDDGFFFDDGFIEFYVLTGASHTLKDVIEYEFIHYKKCYYLTNNDSIFNSIFTKMDSVLIPAVDKCLQRETCYNNSFFYNHRQARIIDGLTGPVRYFYDYASDTVKARNAAISSIAPAKYKLETIHVQNHRLTASPKLLGREFTLFDVNGHELRRGTLQNNMQLPAFPTVIKIQGFGTRLLNSR